MPRKGNHRSDGQPFYHRLCPDDRSELADGSFDAPPLPLLLAAVLPTARPEAVARAAVGAGFAYELLDEDDTPPLPVLAPEPAAPPGLEALIEEPPIPGRFSPCGGNDK